VTEVPQAARAAGSRARRILAGRRDQARGALLERYYRARRRQPLDPHLAVFAAYWYRGYQCNPRAIYERALETVPGLRGVWVVNPDRVHTIPDGVEHVVAGTRAYFDVLARASVLVNNVNYPNHLVKRPGTTHVMTHHGTPLKRMGLDLQGTDTRDGRIDFDALLRRCARWDYSVAANPHSAAVWERAYPGSYASLVVGYPRNDALASATSDQAARIRRSLGIADDRRALLYAPTHRDHVHGELPHVDVLALARDLGEEWVVLSRLHHLYDDGRAAGGGQVLDVTAHPSIEDLCIAADVLVTDYSSVMFDYAVLDRPIVVHAPDWDDYRDARGVYFDLLAEPPGTVVRTQAELAAALRSGAALGEEAARARTRFRERFCALEDGHASDRVIAAVWPAAISASG